MQGEGLAPSGLRGRVGRPVSEDDILELTLVFLGLAGGAVLGFAARTAHFCTLGAIEECYYGSERTRLRSWLLAIGVAVALTQFLDIAGYVNLRQSFRLSPDVFWFGAILGGLLFGFGMALVGTCAFGMLVRLGGGDMRALISTMTVGLVGFMTMSGIFAEARVRWIDSVYFTLPDGMNQSLNSILFGSSVQGQVMVASAVVLATAGWALSGERFRRNSRQIIAATAIGAVIAYGWLVTSMAADSLTVNPHRLESYSFVRPIGYAILWLMTASGSTATFLIGGVFGVPLGSYIAARRNLDVIWEAFDDAREMRRHLSGSALMGIGGVMAMGCTIGQGMSGVATLALTSLLAAGSIVIGAVLGIRWLIEGRLPDPRILLARLLGGKGE